MQQYWGKWCVIVVMWSCMGTLTAQTPQVIRRSVVENAYIPWDLEWWGPDTLLYTQRNGLVQRAALSTNQLKTLFTIDTVAELQHAGLMGMAMHPQWPDTPAVFITYTYYNAVFDVFLRLERLRYEAGTDTLVREQVIIERIPAASTTTGARVVASTDGYLYLSVGTINLGVVAQDSAALNGKILRFHLDGSIPPDNPIAGSPVYTLGHRNVQGLALSPDGTLYASEHGNFSNDELNILRNGRNYGWPEISGFCNGQPACQTLNLVDPLYVWSSPIAPCGLAYQARSNGANVLLLTSLVGEALYRLELSNDGTQVIKEDALLKGQIGRIRDVLVAPNGQVFVSTSNRDNVQSPTMNDDQIYEVFVIPVPVEAAVNQQMVISHQQQRLRINYQPGFLPGTSLKVVNNLGQVLHEATLPFGQTDWQMPFHPGAGTYHVLLYQQSSLHLIQTLILHHDK